VTLSVRLTPAAFFIVSLDAFVVPHRIKLWVITMFIARNILTVRTVHAHGSTLNSVCVAFDSLRVSICHRPFGFHQSSCYVFPLFHSTCTCTALPPFLLPPFSPQMVTESFVSPQHFSPAPICIVSCTMTTKLRLNMLLQLTVFGLKYLVHQVHAPLCLNQ
jgi:hypothetical protein